MGSTNLILLVGEDLIHDIVDNRLDRDDGVDQGCGSYLMGTPRHQLSLSLETRCRIVYDRVEQRRIWCHKTLRREWLAGTPEMLLFRTASLFYFIT